MCDYVRECGRCKKIKPDGARCRLRTCKTFPYCWIHLKYKEGFRVKDSTIPGAGQGVFYIGRPLTPELKVVRRADPNAQEIIDYQRIDNGNFVMDYCGEIFDNPSIPNEVPIQYSMSDLRMSNANFNLPSDRRYYNKERFEDGQVTPVNFRTRAAAERKRDIAINAGSTQSCIARYINSSPTPNCMVLGDDDLMTHHGKNLNETAPYLRYFGDPPYGKWLFSLPIVATQEINPGDEIFLDYGDNSGNIVNIQRPSRAECEQMLEENDTSLTPGFDATIIRQNRRNGNNREFGKYIDPDAIPSENYRNMGAFTPFDFNRYKEQENEHVVYLGVP